MKKIFTTLALAAVVLGANAQDPTIGLVGNFQGWAVDEALELKSEGNLVYTLENVPLLDSFKFVEAVDGVFSWENPNYGAAGEVTLGEAVEVVEGGGNFGFANKMINAVNCSIKLDLGNMTCVINGTPGEYQTGDDVYSLVGAFQGWAVDAGDADFEKVGEGKYQQPIPEAFLAMDEATLAASEFKVVMNHSWSPVNWGSDGESTLLLDLPYELVEGNNPGNICFSEGTELNKDMYVVLIMTEEEKTLTITEDPDSVNPEGAVATIAAEVANGNVYNVAGVCVARNANSLNGLAKGLYILNGKKYVVK